MPSVAVDSGILCAMFDASDRQHRRAVAFLAEPGMSLVTNIPVVTEVVYLLRFSVAAQRAFLDFVGAAIELDERTMPDFPRIAEIMGKYSDLPADFADASLVAMCERRGIGRVATFDRDFEVYRMGNGQALRNVLAGEGEAGP